MKIKLLLKNTLLIAAGLLAGATNAWADAVASYNFDSQTTPFTIADANRLSVSYQQYEEGGSDYYAKYTCGNMNAVAFAYYNFSSSVNDAETVTVEFDFYVSQSAGYLYISLADADYHTKDAGGFTGKSNSGYGATGAIFNVGCRGSSNSQPFSVNSVANNASGLATWCHANVTVNNSTKKVSYTIKNSEDETLASGSDVNFLNASAQRCSQIDIYIGTNASGNAVHIDNLTITKTVSEVEHNYTINATAGGTVIKTFAEGKAVENASFSTFIPKVILYNNKYYVLDDAGNANLNGYYASYSMGTTDANPSINYTLDESIAYFSEYEALTNSRNYGTQSSNSNYSNGGGYGLYQGANSYTGVISETESGFYELQLAVVARNTDKEDKNVLKAKNGDTYVGEYEFKHSSNTGVYTCPGIYIPAGYSLYIEDILTGNSNAYYDYIVLKKVASVPATITSAGWATLYTDYPLDFSGVEGLEAYTATLNENTVTLTKVNDVPAGTGVVLKGDANTYSVPVIAYSSTDKGSMKGSTTEAKEATTESPIYILKLNGNEAQFMRATSGSLAAGKAYLELTSQAKAMSVVFANDPTGIANVNAAEEAQPAKRIVNGQLVIEKNGKRYNAAGAEF